MAAEKRKQAAVEMKANRDKARAEAAAQGNEDTSVLDTLLEKLRNGDSVGRKRRARNSERRPAAPLELKAETLLLADSGNDTVDLARDMLAQLKSDGFDALTPTSPTSANAPRRSRRRAPSTTPFKGIEEELESSTSGQADDLTLDGDTLAAVSEDADEVAEDADITIVSEPSKTMDVELDSTPGAPDPVMVDP